MEPFAVRQRTDTQGESETISAIGFDYSEIDRLLLGEHDPENEETRKLKADWEIEGRSSASADLLRLTLENLLPNGHLGRATPQSIGLRCVCLLWMLQSEKHELGNKSLATIAGALKVSRAIMSYHVRTLEEQIGFYHARGQKRVEAREAYKESVQAGWSTRREKHGATGRKAPMRPKARIAGGESPPEI